MSSFIRSIGLEEDGADVLDSQNRPTYSKVEETARRVTTLWSMMAERKVDPTPNWTSADGPGKDELAMVCLHSCFALLIIIRCHDQNLQIGGKEPYTDIFVVPS